MLPVPLAVLFGCAAAGVAFIGLRGTGGRVLWGAFAAASAAPILFYAIFGTSRALAVGPVAVVSLMTAAALGKIVDQGTAGYAVAALSLAACNKPADTAAEAAATAAGLVIILMVRFWMA